MSGIKMMSRRLGAIALAMTFVGSGLLFTTNAGAAPASPQVINECGMIDGNYMCGTPQWMQAALNAANNLTVTVGNNLPPIKANYCKQISAVTASISAALFFLPEAALVTYLSGTFAGLTLGELQQCNGF